MRSIQFNSTVAVTLLLNFCVWMSDDCRQNVKEYLKVRRSLVTRAISSKWIGTTFWFSFDSICNNGRKMFLFEAVNMHHLYDMALAPQYTLTFPALFCTFFKCVSSRLLFIVFSPPRIKLSMQGEFPFRSRSIRDNLLERDWCQPHIDIDINYLYLWRQLVIIRL